jgi:hypothetical protein
VLTVLLLVALAAAVPVLSGIVRDGRERRRKWKSGEMERYSEDEEYDAGPPAVLDADGTAAETKHCRHCGAENDAGFTYCRVCTRPL